PGLIQRSAERGLVALGSEERDDRALETFAMRLRAVLENALDHGPRLLPLVGLQTEEQRDLVREVLIKRTDAHARLVGHAHGREAGPPFGERNAKGRLEDVAHELRRTSLARPLSPRNRRSIASRHPRLQNANHASRAPFVPYRA